MEAFFFTRDYESVQIVQTSEYIQRCREVQQPICFLLKANHQMAVGTYERTYSETLAFSGHAEGKRVTQNWKIKEESIEVLAVSVLVR
jgi:hypothetical protein